MIRSEWFDHCDCVKPLSDVVEFWDSRRRPVKEANRIPGEYAYYGANGQQGTIDGYLFDEPLILLAEDGGHFWDEEPISYIASGKYWVNNHAHVLKPKAGYDLSFINHQLSLYDVSRFVTGTTRGKLTKTAASDIPIYCPSLTEQRRIAGILDKADAIRKQRRQALTLADEFLKSTFLDMFGDPVTNPKGWNTKSLKSMTTKIGSGATPRGGKESYQDEGISLIRSLNIHDADFRYKDLAHINDQQAHDLRNVIVESGDVLLNITGASVCRCAIVPDDILPARVNQHVAIVRPNRKKLSPEFLQFLLISPNYKKFLLKLATNGGATREALTKEQVQGLDIITPTIDMQNRFSEIVQQQREMVSKAQTVADESDNLFHSLVQRAFRGNL